MEHKPFGQLPREEQLALFAAWLDGKQIEIQATPNNWYTGKPLWELNSLYRIALKPDVIPWPAIQRRFKFAARDQDGEVWVFTHKPELVTTKWSINGLGYVGGANARVSDVLEDFVLGDTPWQESLQERP